MTKDEMVHLLRTDVQEWNRFLTHSRRENNRRSDQPKTDLSGVDLSFANLTFAYLVGVNLSGATLHFTYLDSARLEGANLSDASLLGAIMRSANFSLANLQRASLERAYAEDANFMWSKMRGANLRDSDLSTASFDGVDFLDVDFTGCLLCRSAFLNSDLSRAKGLEAVKHLAPSTLGLDTIYQSRGKIPESFLRDAGVPEGFITQMHSLIGAQEGIQFYSCFISLSFHDQTFADRLHGRMRDSKLRVWYAPEDMQGGKKTHEQIETAIRLHDKLLLVLSEASLASEWVKTEIRNARRAERKTGKRKLFPVRLVDFDTIREWECFDADGGKDLGVELREYYIPDFSHWKDHDQFEAEFKKLLRDLKAEANPPADASNAQLDAASR